MPTAQRIETLPHCSLRTMSLQGSLPTPRSRRSSQILRPRSPISTCVADDRTTRRVARTNVIDDREPPSGEASSDSGGEGPPSEQPVIEEPPPYRPDPGPDHFLEHEAKWGQ